LLRFIFSFLGGIFAFVTNGAVFAAAGVMAILYTYSRDLPNHEQLAQYTPPTISRIYSVEGRIIDEFAQERRIYAPVDEIPDLVKQAFISAEDKNFYTHDGFDARGIAAAVVEAVETRGGRVRGASTIPQQVVKNFLLSSDRSAERKLKELILAVRLDRTLTKDKILELYLNEIFLGQNSYGVAAAAQTYFNKTLSQLSVEEAAYLAALPQRPGNLHPVRDREEAIGRRNYVLREMHDNGHIDAAALEIALAQPLRTVQSGDFEGFRQQLPPRDYFTDEIRRQLSRDFGEGEFLGGGMTVRATYDPDLQSEAQAALRDALEDFDRRQGEWRGTGVALPADALGSEATWREALAAADVPRDVEGWSPAVVLELTDTAARIGIEGQPADDDGDWIQADDLNWIRGARRASDILARGEVIHVTRNGGPDDDPRWSLRQIPEVQGAFMAMDVQTGRVLAMQGGFSYQSSSFNRATQAQRQPGSAFKPFVYAAALDSGFTPASIVLDAPIELETAQGIWRPQNASNQFYGPQPLRTGIEMSRNLMTVRLAQEVTMDTVASYAERFGVYDRMGRFLANSLGSEETTLYKMVAAYAMFANGGRRVEPTLVDRVQDRWGTTIYRHDDRQCPDCLQPMLAPGEAPTIIAERRQVIDPITAYQVTSMLEGVVQRGTASGTVRLGVPAGGKTGTTNDARDVWFVGFTSNIAAGCYIGYDQPRTLGPRAFGGTLCAPVFQAFMEEAVAKYGGGPFEVPPGGQFIRIDRHTGARLPDGASGANVVAEYFRAGAEPVFGVMYDGGFALGSDLPMTGAGFGPDEMVTIETSDGAVVQVPRAAATSGQISSGGLY
jgi:penicillin-binding protein 1A